jgi:hypothetical protein
MKKYKQLNLPLVFEEDNSNVLLFPSKKVIEKNRREKKNRREQAIKKGIEKCVKSMKW